MKEKSQKLSVVGWLLLTTYPVWGIGLIAAFAGLIERLGSTPIAQLVMIFGVFTLPIGLVPFWLIRIPFLAKVVVSIMYITAIAVPVFTVGVISICAAGKSHC